MLPTVAVLVSALASTVAIATTPSDPESSTLTPFEQSLDRLPASALDPQGAVLSYVDLELAWDRIGVGTAVEERLNGVGSLSDLATWTQTPFLFGQYSALVDEARAEVGFTTFDIEREISVQAPPRNITIAETRISPEVIAAALQDDPLWSSELTMVEHRYGGYFQWGTDPMATNLQLVSPMRPLGQGGQLALVGSDAEAIVVRTLDAADTEAVLSTAVGDADSLLHDEFISTAVAAFREGDVLNLTALDEAVSFDPAAMLLTPAQAEALLADLVLLRPYAGVVIVDLYDGAQTTTEVLLLHADEAGAQFNAGLVEQALAESFDVLTQLPMAQALPGAEVAVAGPVVVVTLPFQGAYPRAQRMLAERSLFPTG